MKTETNEQWVSRMSHLVRAHAAMRGVTVAESWEVQGRWVRAAAALKNLDPVTAPALVLEAALRDAALPCDPAILDSTRATRTNVTWAQEKAWTGRDWMLHDA